MNLIDWVILIWLGLACVSGIRFGLVYRLGRLVGLFVGIYLAGKYYNVISGWFGDSPWSKIGAFQLILSGISMISGYIALIANKIFRFVAFIPFLKTANRILGGVLGVVTHVLIISIVVFFLSRVSLSATLTQTLTESQLVPMFLGLGNALAVFLPKDITELQKLF